MPTIKAVIAAAESYSFQPDGSVALAGRLGSVWVFPDGSLHPTSLVPGTHGYPSYRDEEYLLQAKKDAQSYLKS